MPFIGQQPKIGAYKLLDSITTSATATYALTASSTAYFPELAQNLIVSLNGVTQAPISAYTVSGSNIVFASALTSSDVIDYILALGDVLSVGSSTNPGLSDLTDTNINTGTLAGTHILGYSTVSSAWVNALPSVWSIPTTSQTVSNITWASGTKALTITKADATFGALTLTDVAIENSDVTFDNLVVNDLHVDNGTNDILRADAGLNKVQIFSDLYVDGIVTATTFRQVDTGTNAFSLGSNGRITTGENLIVTGDLGIGVSSPTAALHVKGDLGLKFVIEGTSAANETLSFSSDNGTGYLLNNSTGTTTGAEGFGFNSANNKIEIKADGGTRMTIRGTGNIGIGTSNPAYRLDIYDTSNPAQMRLRYFQNTNGFFFKNYNGNEAQLVNADDGPMIFKTNNSERMRIQNDGKIGIKKSNPAYPVHIVDGGNTAMYIEGDQNGYTQGAICIASDTTDTSGYRGQGIYMFNHGADTTWYIGGVYTASDRFDICRKGSTTSFDEGAAQSTYSLATFSNSGNLSIDGSLSQNSDVSIKDNVQNLSSQLENINALRPVEYDRNDKLKAGEHEIGLIAQEVEALLPDLVGDRNGLKTLDYARLSVILLKGLQELSAKVTALESN